MKLKNRPTMTTSTAMSDTEVELLYARNSEQHSAYQQSPEHTNRWDSVGQAFRAEQWQRLCTLEEDWDGEGGLAPSLKALEIAGDILEQLNAKVPLPELMASPTGGVLLEWEYPDVELLIHIYRSGEIAAVIDTSEISEEGPLAKVTDQLDTALAILTNHL